MMETSTKVFLGVVVVALVGGAIAYSVQQATQPLGSTWAYTYKGYTINVVCGGLGSTCSAGWTVVVGGMSYSDQVVGQPTGAAALSAAQAKIDAYSSGEMP